MPAKLCMCLTHHKPRVKAVIAITSSSRDSEVSGSKLKIPQAGQRGH